PTPRMLARAIRRTCARRQGWSAPPIVRSSRAQSRLVIGFGEVLAKAVEAELPTRPPRVDPLLHGAQRRRLDPAGSHPPDLLGADEAAQPQHLKVLDHRRERHRQWLCE